MSRGFEVKITLRPDGDVYARRFTRFASELTDFAPAFEDMADEFGKYEREVFESEGARAGAAWAPLKQATIDRKGHARRLYDTGTMMADASGPGVRIITSRTLTLGLLTPYAIYHQGGTRNMVARPVIRLNSEIKRAWDKIIHRWLVKSATGSGLSL